MTSLSTLYDLAPLRPHQRYITSSQTPQAPGLKGARVKGIHSTPPTGHLTLPNAISSPASLIASPSPVVLFSLVHSFPPRRSASPTPSVYTSPFPPSRNADRRRRLHGRRHPRPLPWRVMGPVRHISHFPSYTHQSRRRRQRAYASEPALDLRRYATASDGRLLPESADVGPDGGFWRFCNGPSVCLYRARETRVEQRGLGWRSAAVA